MLIHEQPTRLVQTVPPDQHHPEEEPEAEPGRRGGGCLTLVVWLTLVPLALLALALLLTPTSETILVLGSDARPDELRRGQIGRTDTIMALVADRATPRVALVSVPRDLWVPIPRYGEERVNAAFELGGAEIAKQTIANTLGIPVHRFLLVGLQGVRDVVDAVGGIDVTVDEAIYDPTYPTDDYGTVEVRIAAGRQHMDGETALRYARTRHQDSDFGRIARQQRVLSAVRTAAFQPTNLYRLPAVISAAQRSVKTDLSALDAVALAAAFLRDRGEPDRLILDGRFVDPLIGQGGAALLVPKPGLQRAVTSFLGTSSVAVDVRNASGIVGAARAVADRLRQEGLAVSSVGDSERSLAQTAIVTRPEARRAAETAARALGVGAGSISETSALPGGVDVRVEVGRDIAR